ncbi:transcriptional regulator [Enterobacter cancerogenus]|uniref:Transcriptional regulator n=1 Tax=Enterobacter cancerogenus TaxID=69218 RepID=A0A484XWJ2_9ENTR|nr:transcriptional regulator [Enterobacter cancerogenus]
MNSFQGSERLIFEYIQFHAHSISNISAKEIARDTFTTTTSVNRVCKKMGYKSYTELRYRFSGRSISGLTRRPLRGGK